MHTEMKNCHGLCGSCWVSVEESSEVARYARQKYRDYNCFSVYAGYCYTFFGSSCKNKGFFVVVEKVAIYRKIKDIKVL